MSLLSISGKPARSSTLVMALLRKILRASFVSSPKIYASYSTHNTDFDFRSVLLPDSRAQIVERAKKLKPVRGPASSKPLRAAAVLVPICEVDGQLALLYTLRSATLRKHKREVSFPGGMAETEEDPIKTAKRETEEELGLPSHNVDVWTTLPSIGSRDGGTNIIPVLGYVGKLDPKSMNINPVEVEFPFVRTLQNLCNPVNHAQTQFRQGYTLPVFLGEPRIWGLTAIITHQVLNVLIPDAFKFRLKFVAPLMKNKSVLK